METVSSHPEFVEGSVSRRDVEGKGNNYPLSIANCQLSVDGGTRSGAYFNAAAYTSEPMYSMQWGIPAVRLPELWAADTSSNTARKVIAIIDTGVDTDHPDLADNIWTNPNESATANGYDNDNNGFVDDLHGWDFVNQTGDIHDFNSHGTHCAGIAAAVGDNGIGITGANPQALIMPVAVMQSNGTGDIATIVRGINYAARNGADVLSMSFGTYAYSIALEQALAQAYQSAVLVAAAGNDGAVIDLRCNPFTPGPMFPAAFTFVLGVQATQQNPGLCGYRACFSNYDCDGPTFSQFNEEQLYNYELSAPGASIYSTVSNGGYRNYNGTSMACPLVAGGVSALLHAKPYPTQEMLWGDLINYSGDNVDFKAVYDAGPAPAVLQFVAYEVCDSTFGDGDNRPDAGETLDIYPTIRTVWGATDSIRLWIDFDEFEDNTTIEFLQNNVDFGRSLSAYSKGKSVNPIRMRIADNVVDGRYIKLVLHASCPNAEENLEFPFTIQVENGVELGGMISDTLILYPDVHYIVTRNLAIAETGLLIIEPGTTLKFKDNVGISNSGRIYAVGEPGNMITFTKTDLGLSWAGLSLNFNDTLDYCTIEYIYNSTRRCISSTIIENYNDYNGYVYEEKTAILSNIVFQYNAAIGVVTITPLYSSNLLYNHSRYSTLFTNLNIMNNLSMSNGYYFRHNGNRPSNNNIIGNYSEVVRDESWFSMIDIESEYNNSYDSAFCCSNICSNNYKYTLYCGSDLPKTILMRVVPYLGSALENIVRKDIYDFEYPGSDTYARLDLSNITTRPFSEAHGIVWKVEVNGYDAQDEFDSIAPLGIGTHEFKVYFNRAMDTAVTPMIAMGVRPPYTQNPITQKGHWSADSTIYTVNLTLSNKFTDGLNRIYVANARDNEYFEIPVENMRFNVYVSAAGSLSNEFMATPGLGKVDLEWNNNEVDYNDFLGYNMYRYVYDSVLTNYHYDSNYGGYVYDTIFAPIDTVMINTSLIQDTLFTDYDVTPGQRYYYFYKVMRTDLTESLSPSKVVSTIPLSSVRGDANGSMAVDVADVVTIVNYITNQNPQPFIFEAADVNSDGTINVLDIVGIINIILHPGRATASDVATARYSIEDGILYVNTPVDLGGVQFTFNMPHDNAIEVLEALNGFERVNSWVGDDQYMFMAYSMSGKKLTAGRHALLRIGDAGIDEIVLSDKYGNNVNAVFDVTSVDFVENMRIGEPYPNPFSNSVVIPFTVKFSESEEIEFVMTDAIGRVIDTKNVGRYGNGSHEYTWTPSSELKPGIYFIETKSNGIVVNKAKVVCVK
ncbi:MAG: S8 family serine peptidase [Bacteroidales bacterium]|nr:S8 family serine peptidase [Bacteroidales bacterium]